jgi:hypothetical protein
MQVEAIYDQGRLEFTVPVRLKHNRVRILVTVEDSEIELDENPYNLPPEIIEAAKAMRARFDAILQAPPPPDEELPELTPKQLERIAAFELRDEIKGLR